MNGRVFYQRHQAGKALSVVLSCMIAASGVFAPLFAQSAEDAVLIPFPDKLMSRTAQDLVRSDAPDQKETAPTDNAADKTSSEKEPAYALQQLEADPAATPDEDASQTKTLKGSVTNLTVIKDRSQIIKFAQNIARVSIANQQLADVLPLSPDQLVINGKATGTTSLIVWDENGQEGIFDLTVQRDTSELMHDIEAIAPNENIHLRATDSGLALWGQASSTVLVDEIKRLASVYNMGNVVDITESPAPQIALEVRIAEASRSTGRLLTHGFATGNNNPNTGGNVVGGLNRLYFLPADDEEEDEDAPAGDAVFPGTMILPTAIGNMGGLTAGFTTLFQKKANFDYRLEALENKGKIRVLAEPTLITTHGREARFHAGGSYPIPNGTDQNGNIQVKLQPYGVDLNFTPWISVRSDRIELKVSTTVSSVDFSIVVQDTPGLLERTAETTVQLKDGQSLFIAGILTRDEQESFAQWPYIANVPILGTLFKNKDLSKSEKELVVIITPHIIPPNERSKFLGSNH